MSSKILCLEGEKSNSPHGNYSIETVLEFLQQSSGIGYEHHRVATRAELDHRLAEFGRLKSYSLLYLAFPGAPGQFSVSAREDVTLDDLAAAAKGGWGNRILHLGCGRTLKVLPKQLDALRRSTGVAMLSGYASAVDFFPMSILELSYFALLDQYRTPAAIAKHLGEQQRYWVKTLGFKLLG
jgi:uncharacterized protein